MIKIDIKKSFPTAKISFNLELKAQRTILFGPSGGGKSTLLKLLAGFYRPDQGKIIVAHKTIFAKDQGIDLPIHHRHFGYLPQDYCLFPHLTVRENILYGLKAHKISYQEKDLRKIIEKLGLSAKLARPAFRRPTTTSCSGENHAYQTPGPAS